MSDEQTRKHTQNDTTTSHQHYHTHGHAHASSQHTSHSNDSDKADIDQCHRSAARFSVFTLPHRPPVS